MNKKKTSRDEKSIITCIIGLMLCSLGSLLNQNIVLIWLGIILCIISEIVTCIDIFKNRK